MTLAAPTMIMLIGRQRSITLSVHSGRWSVFRGRKKIGLVRLLSSSADHGKPDAIREVDKAALLRAATTTTQTAKERTFSKRSVGPYAVASALVGAAILGYQSYEIRRWRRDQIEGLALATDVWSEHYPHRKLEDVEPELERCGLMGRTRSVKTDLERIREWHARNEYPGGLVLRDVSLPLFFFEEGERKDQVDAQPQQPIQDLETEGESLNVTPTQSRSPVSYMTMTLKDFLLDPVRLARRECYYVYYEVTPRGQQKQQIFCRGTTILMDVLTCLEAWMWRDPELECRVHRGFCRQADRILNDVVPLLAPPGDRRATVEVCGHSLGGAVAVLLAAKLRRRGYQVVRVTTAGAPRFCATEADANSLLRELPSDYLRIEQELDFVPFLPPFGAHVGNKLWLLRDTPARFVKKADDSWWADSVWYNFLVWETLRSKGSCHRVPTYAAELKSILSD
jgi:hypothetical protein